MKKIYLSTFVLLIASAVKSQTLTQASNAPANGDMYTTERCDSITTTPGAAGANATWNFSSITVFSNKVSSYTTTPSTTSGYPAGSLLTAASVNNKAYFLPSASDLEYFGGSIATGSIVASLIYTSPAIFAAYPMSLNTSSTVATAGSINISSPSSIPGTFTGHSAVLADGSGTLLLPGAMGTFTNVLRVVTSQTLNFTASIVSGTVTEKIYDYYTPTIKAPLFTISTSTITSNILAPATQTFVTINRDYTVTTVPTAIQEAKNIVPGVTVYPNPASSQINFMTDSKTLKTIHLFDVSGRLIGKENLTEGNLKLDVSGFSKGIYVYKLLDQNGEAVKTGKFTIN